jgi:enamine deaminase RidA (YjgF/YER057c/UK114 family)
MKKIERTGTTRRWSDSVRHQGVLYFVEVANSPNSDFETQCKEVLQNAELTLKKNHSTTSHLLMCTIFLKDISHIDVLNSIWEKWLPDGAAPVRACVQATLASPDYLIEIIFQAAYQDI